MVKSPQRFAERVPHKAGRGSAAKPPLTAERLKAVAPIVWELMRPRKRLLALGFLLMVINRVSGLVLPYSTRYLIDSVIAKHHVELLRRLVLGRCCGATVIQGITSFSLTQLAVESGAASDRRAAPEGAERTSRACRFRSTTRIKPARWSRAS